MAAIAPRLREQWHFHPFGTMLTLSLLSFGIALIAIGVVAVVVVRQRQATRCAHLLFCFVSRLVHRGFRFVRGRGAIDDDRNLKLEFILATREARNQNSYST